MTAQPETFSDQPLRFSLRTLSSVHSELKAFCVM